MTDPTLKAEHDVDALIVGAGMAGLTAAAELQRAGRSVLVLDKGRGVGGRMASRRIGDATFDMARNLSLRATRVLLPRWKSGHKTESWRNGAAGLQQKPTAIHAGVESQP